jgi:S-adenosylmethionine:tRNA ribosyltransferase-isomerase
MKVDDLQFDRPAGLEATSPAERRGLARDEVRLMVTRKGRSEDHRFLELPRILRAGDLLVVNRSATLAASLPAMGPAGPFRISLSTEYGQGVWLTEPRVSSAVPGPLPLADQDQLTVAGVPARFVSEFPGLPRLAFLRFQGDLRRAMRRHGEPVRYSYASGAFPLEDYQTIFGAVPGSAEMASAGRPFSARILEQLRRRRISVAEILLHAGVSSLEIETERVEASPVAPEPFAVPSRTVEAIAETRERGGRVIAIGTTVVRALAAARSGGELRAARGFTRILLGPENPPEGIDAILTGFHDPRTTHLALLHGIAGRHAIDQSYSAAVARGYLWHEFGDSHLLFAAG